MPTKPLHPCNHSGCPSLTDSRFCVAHKRANQKRIDANRPNASARGYDGKWRATVKGFIAKHRLCVIKLAKCTVFSQTIDHIWQPACLSCNSAKNIASEGGFGNRRQTA